MTFVLEEVEGAILKFHDVAIFFFFSKGNPILLMETILMYDARQHRLLLYRSSHI